MRVLSLIPRSSSEFANVLRFANTIYDNRYCASNTSRPDYFIAIGDDRGYIGCVGVFFATSHNPLFFEQFFAGNILNELAAGLHRSAFAEIGNLAVDGESVLPQEVQQIAAVLIAAAGLVATHHAIQRLVFIGDRLLGRFSRIFGIPFQNLGRVDPTHIDEETRAMMERYFKSGRAAYVTTTIDIPSIFPELISKICAGLDTMATEAIFSSPVPTLATA